MRRRVVAAPVELPARLRTFDPAAWGAPGAEPESEQWRQGRKRWWDAQYEWGGPLGITPLDLVRARMGVRRRGLAMQEALLQALAHRDCWPCVGGRGRSRRW